jgi:hypothetical protein
MSSAAKTYDVNVTREGRWWMVEVPAIDGLTQARRISEVEEMARSLVSITLDVPPSSVKLGRIGIRVQGMKNVTDAVAEVTALRNEAVHADAKAAEVMRKSAQQLAKADVPMRDIGSLLGVSHQRVSQLLTGEQRQATKPRSVTRSSKSGRIVRTTKTRRKTNA